MATFLELVNKVAADSGTLSGSLGTVANASGRWLKVINWTAEAWELVQKARSDWTFRRKQFSGDLSIDVTNYTAAAFGISDFGGWLRPMPEFEPFSMYDGDIGRSDERILRLIDYFDWINLYDRGASTSQRPVDIAVGSDRSLNVGPAPDKGYTLRGWYKRSVQRLSADTDLPYIDEEYHDIIKWRAIMLLADFDEGAATLATASEKYRQLHLQMLAEFLPKAKV